MSYNGNVHNVETGITARTSKGIISKASECIVRNNALSNQREKRGKALGHGPDHPLISSSSSAPITTQNMATESRLDDTEPRMRARSSTNSFSAFGWRRPPPPTPTTATSATPSKALPIEGLIESLTPPSVPSLNYARSLSALLPSAFPCPSLHVLTPILGSLCAQDSPASVQAAGFEILAAYFSNSASSSLTNTDVLACFALFRAPWSLELWEYRFRAFIAFSDAIPHKDTFTCDSIDLIKHWIKSAFDPLLTSYPLPFMESAERQRSLDDFSTLLVSFFQRSDPVTNPFQEQVVDVLDFLGNMVHLAILLPADQTVSPIYHSPLPPPPDQSPHRFLHRRNQSSASIATLGSPASIRHPADIAINSYLLYLSTQLRHLSYTHLDAILPLLFRALAFYASPLPRLSLSPLPEHHSQSEKDICSMLDSLFGGSHSTSCSVILKHYLFPTFQEDQDPLSSIQLSIGAYRVLHNFMRRGLLTRLARTYIARASSVSYTPSGSPGQIDLPPDVIQLAWPKEDLAVWELSKVSYIICKSVAEWVQWQPDDVTIQHAPIRDLVLIEAAGIVNDVLQAFDDSVDDDDLDEEESSAVGRILLELVSYLRLWQ
jgi:tuberous sclerosis protein 2